MVNLFKQKARTTKRIVDNGDVDALLKPAEADALNSALTTFDNPFALALKDPLASHGAESSKAPPDRDNGVGGRGRRAEAPSDSPPAERQGRRRRRDEPPPSAGQPGDAPLRPGPVRRDEPSPSPAEPSDAPRAGPRPARRADPPPRAEEPRRAPFLGPRPAPRREPPPRVEEPAGAPVLGPRPAARDESPPSIETNGEWGMKSTGARPAIQPGFKSSHRLAERDEPEPDVPKFKSVPSELLSHPFSLNGRAGATPHAELWEAFTPSKPKKSSRFFAGRRWAIQRVITAIEEDQAHIVIYGPRGIGKTSLVNVLAEAAGEVDYEVLRYPCSSGTTFEEIFRGLLRSLPSEFMDRAAQAKFRDVDNLGQLLPEGEFGPTELTETLNQLKLEHAIMIIDEFDRVESKELKTQLAEAIKNLSDASARVTFIIVGIARSLEELIGMHPSIQRNLVGIRLPLMEPSELERVVLSGEEASGTRFDDATRDAIVSFSKGLPYYAQLLALHAGRVALERDAPIVEMTDLRAAVGKVLEDADPLARTSYEIATKDEANLFAVDVLYAAAAAAFDSYGSFSVSDMAKTCIDENGKTIPEITLVKALDELSQKKNAQIFDKWKTPTARTRYSFVLQTMRQYILLRQAARRGLM